jgi:hypothetical protein
LIILSGGFVLAHADAVADADVVALALGGT